MNAPFLSRLIASAVSVSNKSANILRDIKKSGELNIQEKAANDYVTRADFLSQLNIIKSLESLFPKMKFCGEEGNLTEEYNDLVTTFDQQALDLSKNLPEAYSSMKEEDVFVWVDPLDGTREYTQGPDKVPEVTVLIGIAWKGRAVAGVVNQPFYKLEESGFYKGRCVWGIEGLGAYDSVNGKILPKEASGDVTKIVTSRSHLTDLIKTDLGSIPKSQLLHAGGAGHKIMMVVEGAADVYIYPRNGTKRWDTCAPEGVLRAIGGSLTDVYGREYSYEKRDDLSVENCYGLIASVNRKPEYYVDFISQALKDKVMEDSTISCL